MLKNTSDRCAEQLGAVWVSWLSKPALPVKGTRGHQPEEAEYLEVPEEGGGTEDNYS